MSECSKWEHPHSSQNTRLETLSGPRMHLQDVISRMWLLSIPMSSYSASLEMPDLASTTKSHIFHLVVSYPKCRSASSKCGSKRPAFDLVLRSQLSTPSRLCSDASGTHAIYTNTHGRVHPRANALSATVWVRGVWGCSRCFRSLPETHAITLMMAPAAEARMCECQVALGEETFAFGKTLIEN